MDRDQPHQPPATRSRARRTRVNSAWKVLPVIFAAAAVYDLTRRVLGYHSSGDWWIYVLLALLMLVLDELNDRRTNREDPEARYLIDRLTAAVSAAEQTART
jgi:hypothetical protein